MALLCFFRNMSRVYYTTSTTPWVISKYIHKHAHTSTLMNQTWWDHWKLKKKSSQPRSKFLYLNELNSKLSNQTEWAKVKLTSEMYVCVCMRIANTFMSIYAHKQWNPIKLTSLIELILLCQLLLHKFHITHDYTIKCIVNLVTILCMHSIVPKFCTR